MPGRRQFRSLPFLRQLPRSRGRVVKREEGERENKTIKGERRILNDNRKNESGVVGALHPEIMSLSAFNDNGKKKELRREGS